MAKVLEPPILLSRMLTFVLATSIVVLGVLGFTLFKMIPLERPEVFFLLTPTRSTNMIIEPLDPDSIDKRTIQNYEEGFIREYIIARNTLVYGSTATEYNWKKIVKPWSSTDVYSEFTNTKLYKEYGFGDKLPNMNCSVEFASPNNDNVILRMNNDLYVGVYNVHFTWICKNIGGQAPLKNYKIQIKVQSELNKKTSGTLSILDKLRENPLGIQVTQYTVLESDDGDQDPLNSDPMGQITSF